MLPLTLGKITFTEDALAAIHAAGQIPEQLLARHMYADWGDVDDHDWAQNNRAKVCGERLLSAYRLRNQVVIWILSEGTPRNTSVLLPF